ncbi:M15 family metallopeptidase [Mesorhizobium australicum]|uniref:M15 family metallopeptidase n=1 Tax=Mesorhizobium australicum TaxID=536018 RepID=UPI003338B5F7
MTNHLERMLLQLVFIWAVCGQGLSAYAADAGDGVDQPAAKAALLKAYPDLFTITGNTLTWTDGTTMVWDDGKERDASALLESPDIEDMFHYIYPLTSAGDLVPADNFDPGRIRNEAFFKKLYGGSEAEVGKHIVHVKWLPKTKHGGTAVRITKLFDIDGRLIMVSNALEAKQADLKYGLEPGGGFLWRCIAGTNQLSVHSFGAAFDINVGYSDYWYWNRPKTKARPLELKAPGAGIPPSGGCPAGPRPDSVVTPEGHIPFKNRIPLAIVALFERYGFIWGGRWYHYDTMHFEYRPELLLYKKPG